MGAVLQGTARKPPVVVMAHGLAGQKDMGLEPFAEAFEGEPRNWVSPRRHLQDWEAALGYARVWGPSCSLSGGAYQGGGVAPILTVGGRERQCQQHFPRACTCVSRCMLTVVATVGMHCIDVSQLQRMHGVLGSVG